MKLKLSNKLIIACIVACFLVLSSCNDRPKNVLSDTKMADILTEMHKLEGSLDAKGISSSQFDIKSKYYNSILEKYNISSADFDSSVVWYTKNPKKFERIYENVNIQLTQLQADVQKGKYHYVDSIELRKIKINIWNKPIKYIFTKDSTRTRLAFEIKDDNLKFGDMYVMKFKQTIAKADSCKNQHILLCINYFNGKIDSVYQKAYNDNLTRRYTFHFPAKQKLKIKSISGELLGSSSYKGTFNSKTDSISLIRVYDPKLQDSLRTVVKKVDPTNYLTPEKQRLDSVLRAKTNPANKENKLLKTKN
jgi:hypothetical protein